MAKKLANFDSGKHPRGTHGRFVATSDHFKLSEQSLKKARVYGTDNSGRKLNLSRIKAEQKTKLFHTSLAKDPEVLAAYNRLAPHQQARLLQAFHNGEVSFSDAHNSKPDPKPNKQHIRIRGVSGQSRKILLSNTSAAQKQSLLQSFEAADRVLLPSGTPRPVKRSELAARAAGVSPGKRIIKGRGKNSEIKVTDKGLEIKIAPHDSSFRKEADPHFSYDILVKQGRVKGAEGYIDQVVTLNSHKTKMYYKGDVFRGVPDLHNDVSHLTDQELFDSAYTAIQETTKGRAPLWKPDVHGSVPDSLVGQVSSRGTPNYMGMQIHHNDQWAKYPAREIEADFAAGRITAEERYDRYLMNLRKSVDNANGWEIDVRGKNDREFIILAGGLHQAGTPLYESVHPHMINPDTGEMEHMSIPKGHSGTGKPTAEGRDDGESRAWFDARVRSQFWKEYYKDQATILTKELQKRVASGYITNEAAKSLLEQAKSNYDAAEKTRKIEAIDNEES